jgi:hypothetical protein
MKTISDLIRVLNEIPAVLSEYMPTEIETAAKDFIALQVTRIRREGLVNKPTYSTKPGIPAYLLKGKNATYPTALNSTGRAFIDKRIKAKPTKANRYANFINHRDMRNAQGLQTAFVDLSYSNDMLNSIGVLGKENARTFYRARLGALSTKASVKFGGNYKRYGDFFQPNQMIRDVVGKASALRTGRFLSVKIGAKILVNNL